MKIKEVLKNLKKKTNKRNTITAFLALFITVAMLVSVAALFSVNGAKSTTAEILDAKGLDFTDNSYMAEKLDELFELLPYGEYPYFTTYGNKSCGNSNCSYCNGFNVSRYHPILKEVGLVDNYYSWSCFGFARYAFLYIFGVQADGLNYFGNNQQQELRRVGRIASNTKDLNSIVGDYDSYTLDSLKELMSKATPGDIIQLRNRGVSGVGNHSMIFLKADDDGIYVLHNNAFRGRVDSEGKTIGYNRVLVSYYTYETIKSTWNSIVTVFRASKDIYDATWSKGYNVCVNHKFSEKSADICENCGFKYERIISTEITGIYKLSDKVTLYEQPYGSSKTKGTLSGNAVVVSSEVNSIGETWFRTTAGVYFKDADATRIENSDTLTISMTLYPVGVKKLYSSFNLSGRIFSLKDELTNVSGYIVNSEGKTLQKVSFDPNASSVDVSTCDINYGLKFGSLTIGEYKLILVASDGDGCNTVFISNFKIAHEATEVDKTDVKAPSAPKSLVVSDNFVLLDYKDGYEYSMDGSKWQTGNLFVDLEPNTAYVFYCRWAETETTYASPKSAALKLSTLKPQVAAQTPKLDGEVGDKWVKLVEVEEHEYSKDGINWQKSPLFTGLKPATKYIFFQRDKDVKKSSAALVVMTTKSIIPPPDAPVIIGRSDTSISVLHSDYYEYAILEIGNPQSAIKWVDLSETDGEFRGLSPAKEYYICCRAKETDVAFASEISEFTKESTDKSHPSSTPPMPTVISKNSSSFIILPLENCEYSLDGETFYRTNVFTGLKAGSVYEVVCRYYETDTSYASENSEVLEIEIVPDTVTSSIYNINEEKKIISNVENGTTVKEFLNNIDQGKYAIAVNYNGKLKDDAVLSTGDEIIINDLMGEVAKYKVAVRGDINKDGEVNITDMLILLSILPEEYSFDSEYHFAADMNCDGRINTLDYAMIRNLINNNDRSQES